MSKWGLCKGANDSAERHNECRQWAAVEDAVYMNLTLLKSHWRKFWILSGSERITPVTPCYRTESALMGSGRGLWRVPAFEEVAVDAGLRRFVNITGLLAVYLFAAKQATDAEALRCGPGESAHRRTRRSVFLRCAQYSRPAEPESETRRG